MELPIIYDIPGLTIPLGEANADGLVQLRIIPAAQLLLLKPDRFPLYDAPVGDAFTIEAANLFFTDRAALVDLPVIPQYATFTEPMEATVNGPVFRPSIQLVIPKVRREVTAWIAYYNQVKWVAFLQDRNGFFRCVGTPEQPLTMGVSQDVGGQNGGRNMTALSFSGEVEQPAYFLNGIQDEDLFLTADFDSSFGVEFNS